MDPHGQALTRKQGGVPISSGELILQNGRHSGSSRPLGVPLTFIGRASGCDIRLNVEGVDPLHCLLVQVPRGWRCAIWIAARGPSSMAKM